MILTKESRYNKDLIDKIMRETLRHGIYVDLDKAEELYREVSNKIEGCKRKGIQELGGECEGINLNSHKQVGVVLKDYLGFGKYAERTKSGGYSFNERVLNRIYEETGNKFVYNLREYRKYNYLGKKIEEIALVVDDNSRVHPEYNYGDTNRISLKKPGLSNISKEIRGIIGTEDGYKIIKADYKAQEVYLQVNMMGIEELKRVFEEYDDFYAGMVKVLTGKELKPDYRDSVKVAWLAGMYNSNLRGIGKCGEERSLVKVLGDKINKIPQVIKYRDYIKREVIKKGNPIRSYFGTERGIPYWVKDEVRKFNIAFNNTFQITGSDMLYFAMERCYNMFKNMGLSFEDIHIYFTMHDELLFYVREDIICKDLIEKIREGMTLDVEGWSKAKVDISIGESY